MWRDALLVAGKDLRIELRSRVALWQVLPVAVLSLVLYAFALGPVRQTLASAAPGLFWLAVLFSTVLATQRSFAIEAGEGTRDGLRVSGIDPAGVFLGKAAAVAAELAVLQIVLWAAMTLLFGVHLHTVWLALVASLLATIGLATAGTLYGALSAGLRVRETLLPLLVLPVLAPVLLAASRAWSGALTGSVSSGLSVAPRARALRRRLPGHRDRPVRAAAGERVSVRPESPSAAAPRPRWLRIVGVAAVVSTAATVWLGLWVTPPDKIQGNLVRLVYLHPPIAWVALYLAFGLAALSSLLYLWRRTRSLFWDRLAAASVEVGVVFNALTLATGMLWGRPTWGVWWTWDARLTSTALLLVLFLGYLALRRVPRIPRSGPAGARWRR